MEIVKLSKTEITSLQLVEQINIFRKSEGGKSELQHSDLLKVIRDEFEEEIAEGNISCVSYKGKNNQDRPMFNLTLSQSKQVLVRESKIVRKAVIKYIEELESKIKNIISEEDMLIQLFPNSDKNLLKLTADNIREVKKLTAEITHKEDVIIGLVDNIDLATKRQRINQVVRWNAKNNNFQEKWRLLYREFELKYHLDLDRRLQSSRIKCLKPKIDSKMKLIEHMDMIPQLYEIACVLFETDMSEIIKRFE